VIAIDSWTRFICDQDWRGKPDKGGSSEILQKPFQERLKGGPGMVWKEMQGRSLHYLGENEKRIHLAGLKDSEAPKNEKE